MIESRRLRWQLLASCVLAAMACVSHADSSSPDSYANLVAFDTADLTGLLAFTAIAATVAWWYLYRKDNVVAYFQALDRREAPAPGAA